MEILKIENLKKIYKTKNIKTEALSKINFSVNKGEFIAIMGESGSGKTTLLNIISTLDKATSGDVFINNTNINELKDSQVAEFRRNELGFVFQEFNLLNQFSNKDNIFLPLVLSNVKKDEMENRLKYISNILGITDILEKYPYEVSGGQRQRIAIARAIITNPALILADEPTGSLDSSSSENILKLFNKINLNGQTILMVTHSLKAASYANRVLFIKDGIVFHEIFKGDTESSQDFMDRISNAQKIIINRKESQVWER